MNYQEVEVAGSSYVRSVRVRIENPISGKKSISFEEERVFSLGGGKTISEHFGYVNESFDASSAQSDFSIVNPENGEPTGEKMTYAQLYVALHSLYLSLARRRDDAMSTPPKIPNEGVEG